jgi:hypothetical protein
MKLKQKLARQSFYELKSDYSTWDEAFIAGFDKAREMIANQFKQGPVMDSNNTYNSLIQVGEEEIEDSKRTFHKPLSHEKSHGELDS